ncbi:MAG: MaoC/PaaZ C-terminal domain-containing protein [Pseudomonadota bacterium]
MVLAAGSAKPGDAHSAIVVEDLKRTMLVQYAGASGDYNPIHTDEIYATQVAGYRTVFAHGMLTMGLTAKMLTDHVGDGRLTRYGVRFTRQVWPGDTLTASAAVTAVTRAEDSEIIEFDVRTINQDGVEVLSGYATAALPLA